MGLCELRCQYAHYTSQIIDVVSVMTRYAPVGVWSRGQHVRGICVKCDRNMPEYARNMRGLPPYPLLTHSTTFQDAASWSWIAVPTFLSLSEAEFGRGHFILLEPAIFKNTNSRIQIIIERSDTTKSNDQVTRRLKNTSKISSTKIQHEKYLKKVAT